MASRVNYVVVAGGESAVAYRRWGAYSVYEQLDRGPEQTLRDVARDSAHGGGPAWDDVMADAGVLIDVDTRRLTFFATESVGEVAVNRAVLRRLAARWAGWEIRWAYQGVHDLWPEVAAQYERDGSSSPHTWMLDERDWTDEADRWEFEGDPVPNAHIDCDLITVRAADGIAHWLYERYEWRWLHGTWDALRALWPGWTVRAWDDRYEKHVAVLDGVVVLPTYDEEAALAALA